MTLAEAAELVGKRVIYRPYSDIDPYEHGEVIGVNDAYVFVLYDGDRGAKATAPQMLEVEV